MHGDEAHTEDYIKEGDSRLTDARSPIAHASTHINGTDDIPLATSTQKGLMSSTEYNKLINTVTGPASSTNDNAAVFDGTTGKVIKDAGFKPIKGPDTSIDGGIAVFDGTDGKVIKDAGFVPGDYGFMPIGVPIPVWDHLAGVNAPPTNQSYRYVKLTAGEDGVGEYNEDILINELVSGSAPMIEATAEISLIDSPLDGETIHLINTEQSFLRAGGTSGILQFDQMRKHSHRFGAETAAAGGDRSIITSNNLSITSAATDGTSRNVSNGYQNFSSVSGGTDQTKFMGDETRAKNVSVTYYMRIK
jgi:hypothetical protein